MRIFRKLRTKRIKRLMANGFFADEAVGWTGILTHGKRRSIVLRRPYVRLMIRDRQLRYADAMERGLSEEEYHREIRSHLAEKGWLDDRGRIDYWRIFRYWRDEAIRRGWESPERPKKPHKKMMDGEIDKEYVKRQAQKYRERDKVKSKAMVGDREEWIRQLRESIERTDSPERQAQFRQQIINLGGTP